MDGQEPTAAEQALILRQMLADGELPHGETYVWNSEAGEFRVEKPVIN